jgi:diguanylate cyclase (GGDEF)-like protein
MPNDAQAATDSPTDLAMIARAPLLDDLADALVVAGIRVERPLPEDTAWQAFLQGAVLCVLAPDAAETPAHGWQSLADRAAQLLPISVAVLPESRRNEQGDWLAAGFDDVLVGSFDAIERATRLRGRMRSRGVRHSLSSRDPLTGLPTQQVFFSRLDPTIRLSSRANMPMAVAVIDVDGFIAIEREKGREVARALLIDMAEHLQTMLRRSDTVARLGDDRFGLILNHITPFEARRLLYKLWRSLGLRPETIERLGESAARVTFTAGVATFPGDSSDGQELFTRAEIALDVARTTGQRRVLLYSETCGDCGVDTHGTDLRYHRTHSGSRDEPE